MLSLINVASENSKFTKFTHFWEHDQDKIK
jgi:hypothetical protein